MLNLRNPRDVGLVIRDRRRKQHLTQAQLADRIGVGRQWLVAVERGKPGAEIGLVMRTLAALGLSLAIEDRETLPGSEPALPDTDIDSIIDGTRTPRP